MHLDDAWLASYEKRKRRKTHNHHTIAFDRVWTSTLAKHSGQDRQDIFDGEEAPLIWAQLTAKAKQ